MKLLVSILPLKKHLGVSQNLICLASSNWNKKKQFLHWFLERIYCLCCQLSLGKAWYNFLIFRCWFTWKKFWWRNLPSLNQDTKLITLARPKKTPELQAKLCPLGGVQGMLPWENVIFETLWKMMFSILGNIWVTFFFARQKC